MAFSKFGLSPAIMDGVKAMGYTEPTPIQTRTIPLVMQGRDVIGSAQTGTGKTAAFALPILNRLSGNPTQLERKTCRILVLSPTRELSGQILDSFNAYGRHLKLRTALAIGGVSMGKQVRELMNGVDVLVATPGRLLDLVNSNALRLTKVEVLVLDEADRMLDMGFIHDIRQIVSKTPAQRQTLLFSATMPKAIADLAGHMLRNPARVAVTPVASTCERVSQRVIHIERAGKPMILAEILREAAMERAIVFTRTKHGADKLVRTLAKERISAEAIHGNKSQPQRERVLAAFRQGHTRILVATDIAARGIDVDGISHVVNYDLPNEPESYVHRIGRTARAGAEGFAVSLCDHDEVPYLRSIEKLIRMSLPATDRRANPGRDLQAKQPNERREGSHRGAQHRDGSQREGSRDGSHRDGARRDGPHRGRNPNGRRGAPQHSHAGGHGEAPKPAQARPADTRGHQGPAKSKPAHVQHEPKDLSGVAFLQRGREPRRTTNRPQR